MKKQFCYKCGTRLISKTITLETYDKKTGEQEKETKFICPNVGTARKLFLGMVPYGETGCYSANSDRMDLCNHPNSGLRSACLGSACPDCGASLNSYGDI